MSAAVVAPWRRNLVLDSIRLRSLAQLKSAYWIGSRDMETDSQFAPLGWMEIMYADFKVWVGRLFAGCSVRHSLAVWSLQLALQMGTLSPNPCVGLLAPSTPRQPRAAAPAVLGEFACKLIAISPKGVCRPPWNPPKLFIAMLGKCCCFTSHHNKNCQQPRGLFL